METVNCDLCGSSKYKKLFNQTDLLHKVTSEKFQLVCCEDCNLHYVNPRPTGQEIGRFYSKEYSYFSGQSFIKKKVASLLKDIINCAYMNDSFGVKKILSKLMLAPLFLPKLREKFPYLLVPKIKSYIEIKTPLTILDIGCGAGENTHMYGWKESLLHLSKNQWDVHGIEPSKKARSRLKERGVHSVHEDLYRAPFRENFFDIIRLNWSLEHVHEPTRYLSRCKALLKDHGKLIIGIPNYEGFTYKIFPQCVELPVHLYYFSVETFKRYARKLDFTILDYYTFSYVPLFLTSLELSGKGDLLTSYKNHPIKSLALNTFFETVKDLDQGDDMVFCLSKNA